MGAPFLEVLKAELDGILGTLVWWEVSLSMAVGWKQMGFKVPSTKLFCDSMMGVV